MFHDLGNVKPDSQMSVASNILGTFILTFLQMKVELCQMPEFFMTILN